MLRGASRDPELFARLAQPFQIGIIQTGIMRKSLPSQKQLKWSQLRVGITVIVASLTLGFLLFLMSGTSGFFTPRMTLKSYFDNAQGCATALRATERRRHWQRDRDPHCARQGQATHARRSDDESEYEIQLCPPSRFGDFARHCWSAWRNLSRYRERSVCPSSRAGWRHTAHETES